MTDGPRKSRRLLTLAAVLGALVLLFLFWGEYDVFSLWSLHSQKAELTREVERLKVENQTLSDQIEGLKNNPELIEKIARENLGMTARGETVYRIIPLNRDTLLDSLKIPE